MSSYQVFISFKNLGHDGSVTRDSALAQELYQFLADHGFRVFFSNVSLEASGTSAYKSAIEAALDQAEVLIAVTTRPEHITSEWVKYEWDSFHNDIISGLKRTGKIFVYVEGIPASGLPRALRQCQVFEHDERDKGRVRTFLLSSLGLRPVDQNLSRPWYRVMSRLVMGAPDVDIECKQCGYDMTFTPADQEGPPMRCPRCRLE